MEQGALSQLHQLSQLSCHPRAQACVQPHVFKQRLQAVLWRGVTVMAVMMIITMNDDGDDDDDEDDGGDDDGGDDHDHDNLRSRVPCSRTCC